MVNSAVQQLCIERERKGSVRERERETEKRERERERAYNTLHFCVTANLTAQPHTPMNTWNRQDAAYK